jgi:hypothetical protein
MIPANVPNVGQYSFNLKQGADASIAMTWLGDDGQPIDLTGFSMKMAIKPFINSTVSRLTLSSDDTTGSYIALGGSDGTIALNFASADTASLQANGLLAQGSGRVVQLGVYDLQYTDPDGNIGYLLEGSITLNLRVTA